ncbi:MAG: HAMP domain-containing histidine kinase [Candidatus Riflebacteria bacterium]|nr:HAMP domain-containing histidine kinase [Candidatus Riflebacteria bacterium]
MTLRKVQISIPFLFFLIIGFASIITLLAIGQAFYSGLRFSNFMLDHANELNLQRDAMFLSDGVETFLRREVAKCFSGSWDKEAADKRLNDRPYIAALWQIDPANRSILVVNASHGVVVQFSPDTDLREIISQGVQALAQSNGTPDYSLFQSDSEFCPILLNTASISHRVDLIWAENEISSEPGKKRGVVFNKEVLYQQVIGKLMRLFCDSWIKLELIDSLGNSVILADSKEVFFNASHIINSDWETMDPLNLSGFLEIFKLRIHFMKGYPQRSFTTTPLTWLMKNSLPVSGMLALLLAVSISFFYYTSKKSTESLSLQNDWIANLSHTLLGPVHSLGILSEAFLIAKPEMQPEFSRLMKSELEIMGKTCRQFMRLSRAGKSCVELNIQSIPLTPVIETLRERVCIRYPFFNKESVQIEGLANISIMGDSAAVAEVFEAALDNALKYSPNGTPVFIKGETVNGEVKIHIIDQGLGIPVGDLARIGELFYRASHENTDGIVGTGAGVYLARILCKKMNGRYEIASSGHGKGCHVTISLPGAKV